MDLKEKDITETIINMFKELKKSILTVTKESMSIMSHRIKNINMEREII